MSNEVTNLKLKRVSSVRKLELPELNERKLEEKLQQKDKKIEEMKKDIHTLEESIHRMKRRN